MWVRMKVWSKGHQIYKEREGCTAFQTYLPQWNQSLTENTGRNARKQPLAVLAQVENSIHCQLDPSTLPILKNKHLNEQRKDQQKLLSSGIFLIKVMEREKKKKNKQTRQAQLLKEVRGQLLRPYLCDPG